MVTTRKRVERWKWGIVEESANLITGVFMRLLGMNGLMVLCYNVTQVYS